MRFARPLRALVGALVVAGCTAGTATTSSAPAPTAGSPVVAVTTTAPQPPGAAEVALEVVAERAAHTATRLADGSVFVAGGCVIDGCGRATVETFLVSADGTTAVRGPDLSEPRDGHTAHVVADGRVVLIGGYAAEGRPPLGAIDVFDPATRSIRVLGDLAQPRGGHVSAVLGDGRILVAGGWIARRTYTASAEVIDPVAGSVTVAPPLPVPLNAAEAVTLADGRVLVTGGQTEEGTGTASAWLFDPSRRVWSATGSMSRPRFKHLAVALPGGEVLVIGGTTDDHEILSTTEIYDPGAGVFWPGPNLVEPRYKLGGGAVLLAGDRVLVGSGGRTVELVDLSAGTSTVLEDLGVQGSFTTTTALGDALVLVLGGYDGRIDLTLLARIIARP